jgi:hypothetical protein
MTPSRAQFHEAREFLRVDVDALGLLAERAVVGAMSALLGEDAGPPTPSSPSMTRSTPCSSP